MRKKTTRRIRQSIVAGVVGVACIFGCENLEVAFAETATVTDATAAVSYTHLTLPTTERV